MLCICLCIFAAAYWNAAAQSVVKLRRSTIKQTKNEALLRFATLKCEQAFSAKTTANKFKTAQNSKNLRLNGHTSFEFQTRNQENHTQKYINR